MISLSFHTTEVSFNKTVQNHHRLFFYISCKASHPAAVYLVHWSEQRHCVELLWCFMSALISWFMNNSTVIADAWQDKDDTYFACSEPDLLHMALLGLTCCPMRDCCSFLMSTRAWAMSSGSLLWDGPPSWEASSPAERQTRTKKPVWARPSAGREFSSTFNLLIFKNKVRSSSRDCERTNNSLLVHLSEALQTEGSENTAEELKTFISELIIVPLSSGPVCVCCETSGDERPTPLFHFKYLTFLVYSSIDETPDVVGDPSVFQGEYSNLSMFLTKHFKNFQGSVWA